MNESAGAYCEPKYIERGVGIILIKDNETRALRKFSIIELNPAAVAPYLQPGIIVN